MKANYENVLNEIRNDTEVGMPKTESEKRKKRAIDREISRAKREKELVNGVIDKEYAQYHEKAFEEYCNLIKKYCTGSRLDWILHYMHEYNSRLPLTPIINDPEDWANTTTTKNGVIKKEYCKRYPKLFKETYEDGRIIYRDNDRIIAFDHILGLIYHFGLCNLVYDEMFPIELPYEVGSENAKFYIHTFLSNRNDKESEFDTAALLFIEKENGEQIPVNRYFRIANEDEEPDIGGWVEIDVEELEERIKASKSNLELSDLCYQLGEGITVCPDGKVVEDIG